MLQPESVVAGLGVGASVTVMFAQVVRDGADLSLGLQSILLGGAIGVFLFFDRRERRAMDERNTERRASDKRKDDEIEALHAEVRRLTDELLRIAKERP